MAIDFKLDRAGIKQLLKSPALAPVVHAQAEAIANGLAVPSDADVVVDDYVTDRVASSVTIRDVRAKGWQAQRGVLTRAAASVGLEVTER